MSRIFVAGATGVLGRRAVARLVAAGHDVTGIARTTPKQTELERLGATPVTVDLFDPAALTAAVTGHDIVCNLATAIPVGDEAAGPSAWAVNDRIRREGARHLADAALAGGARRYVQESIALLYADGGDDLLEEDAPLSPTAITGSALAAEGTAASFAEHGGAGIVLRFGMFYGPDSGHTIEAIEATRAGRPAEVGPAGAYRSPVTTDDAASAVVAALGVPSGIYNVVDDRPLPRREYVDALARALGVAPPVPPSLDVPLPPGYAPLAWSQRVSNARFREATAWRPGSPSAGEGWHAVVDGWRSRLAVDEANVA
ncbi:MAG TPA: NAD(P)-dependent oxidoreductase [Acidimicrobiales bacterium]|nr:NAD(P)-dependent oxidoreductase [Acidimicrobiales bacterium]